MTMCILCPEGHPVVVAASKRGCTVICPRCLASFHADLDVAPLYHARKEEKSSDDEEVDVRIQAEKPQKKVSVKKVIKADDDEEEEEKAPQKKAGVKKVKKELSEEDAKAGIQAGQPPKKVKAKTPPKVKEEEEDEEEDEDDEPRRARSRADDDDEDEIEEEALEDDEKEPEEPIEWTRKKRQLSTANIGMLLYTISVYILLVMFVLWGVMSVVAMVCMVIAIFSEDPTLFLLVLTLTFVMEFILFVPIYICHFIAWVTGLFSPPKSGGRVVCMTALGLFFSPILLYAVWGIFHWLIIERDDVSNNMFKMMHVFTFLLLKTAFYCSLIYIGKLANFMKVSDDRKPQALGWLIVGGSIFLTIMLLLLPIVPTIYAKIIVVVVAFELFYLVITSLKELLEVLGRTRKAINKFIKDER